MTNRFIENLEEIKAQLDPEAVLEYLQPGRKKRSGRELRSPCPVHGGDGAENFCLNLDTRNWICHSQGCKGTNLIDLYAQSKKTPINVAAEELAARFGITVRYRESGKRSQNASYKPEDVLRCWDDAKPNGKDVYFSNKGLQPPPIAKFGKNPYGHQSTLIALKDINGKLKCLLSLSSSGKFNFGKPKEAFAQMGEISPDGEFYAGEGIATVQTAWESSERKLPAVSCGTWSNIEPVVTAIKGKYPNAKPIILIDCDEGGNGLKAAKAVKQKWPEATFRKPSFEEFPNPNNEKRTDFNDIISKCKQPLDVVRRQLDIEFDISSVKEDSKKEPANNTETENGVPESMDFYGKLGKIIKDPDFALRSKGRNYATFEKEHKALFASGGLVTGYEKVDEDLYFAKGDLVVVQAMSNHGKTAFMVQLAHNILDNEENKKTDPMCIFITYESMAIRIEEKLLNLIGKECGDDAAVLYTRKSQEKFLYPDSRDHRQTIGRFNEMLEQNRIVTLNRVPLERIEALIDLYQAKYPQRTIILFLDYIQIIESDIKAEKGWERIKDTAYGLEHIAIEKKIIIFTGCQVNENRQTREGRDIYNAATTVIDIFNHSHAALLSNKDLKTSHKSKEGNKSICTFSAVKQKHGSSFTLESYFLFDGHRFEENTRDSPLVLNARTRLKQSDPLAGVKGINS